MTGLGRKSVPKTTNVPFRGRDAGNKISMSALHFFASLIARSDHQESPAISEDSPPHDLHRHLSASLRGAAIGRLLGFLEEDGIWTTLLVPQKSSSPTITHQNVELLEAYLSDFDCEIRTAHDGEETLHVVAEFAPDLLLLDVMMPRLSGFEVCKKIRANRRQTKDLLILMVTALNEAADFERGVQAGTDDFLTKPVNKVELLCRIRSLLRVRHLKTQLDRTLAYLAEFEATSRASAPQS